MNSKIIKNGAVIAALGLIASYDNTSVNALNINTMHQVDASTHNGGIFGKMIEQVMAPQMLAEEKKKAANRKQEQLDQAQKEYDQQVAQEEAEELQRKKKEDDLAETAALEAAKNSPQARMLAAANDAASNINMGEMEATIQAQLQAKLNSGMSKSELIASAGNEELISTATANPAYSAPAAYSAPIALPQQSNAASVIASVLAKHKAAASQAVVAETPAPVVIAVKSVAAPVQSASQQSAEAKASQEKVKEMASKLGVPFTADLMALGSNSAISDALIEKAVAAGKSETEINAAMASL